MARSLFLNALILAAIGLFIGCGSSNSDFFFGNQGQQSPPVSTVGSIRLNQVLLRSVPMSVTDQRFRGFDVTGVVRYGPVSFPKAPTIVLANVPTNVVRLQIDYLDDGVLVGTGSLTVEVRPNQTTVIESPDFVDLEPANPTPSPSPTATTAPTPTPTATPTPTPTATPTPTPTVTPTPTPTVTPTPTPTVTPTPTPSPNDDVRGQGIVNSSTLEVSTASFLGQGLDEGVKGADIAPDRKIVLGGKISNTTFQGVIPIELTLGQPASGGAIFRLSGDGRTVVSVTLLGSDVTDLAVHPTSGEILVATPEAVVLLNATADAIVWSAGSGGSRVDIGSDGTLAYVNGNSTVILSSNRTQTETLQEGVDYSATDVTDVCVEPTTMRVVVSGWEQRDDNTGNVRQWQSPWLKAYSYNGAAAWTAYDFSNSQADAESRGSDSRMNVVSRGEDGQIYAAGQSSGGESVFQRLPQDISTNAGLVGNDTYTIPSNLGGPNITFYGRFSPVNGTLQAGQIVLTRLMNGSGNTIVPRAIAADGTGRVFLAGSANASLANRDNLIINGQNIGGYSGQDGFILVASSDLSTRELWTSFTTGGRMTGLALAVDSEKVVFAGQGRQNAAQTTSPFVTVEPIQSSFSNDTNDRMGFFAVFKAP